MITGVDFICLPTRDFSAATEFYGTVLGLECSKRWGDMPAGEFETGTLTIAVMQSDAFGLEFAPHTHPIELHVDDVAAARAELEAKGSPSPPTPWTAASATWPTSKTRTETSSCSTTATPIRRPALVGQHEIGGRASRSRSSPAGYLSSRDNLRSLRTRPPVWHCGQ